MRLKGEYVRLDVDMHKTEEGAGTRDAGVGSWVIEV